MYLIVSPQRAKMLSIEISYFKGYSSHPTPFQHCDTLYKIAGAIHLNNTFADMKIPSPNTLIK